MDNKNTIVALVLMTLVWLGFSLFFPQQETQTPSISGDSPATVSPRVPTESTEPNGTAESLAPLVAEKDSSLAAVGVEKRITVENEVFRLVLTSVGAGVESFELKNYQVSADEASPLVQLVEGAPGSAGTVLVSGEDGWGLPGNAVYRLVTPEEAIQIKGEEKKIISFRWQSPDGLLVEKEFSFTGNLYQYGVEVKLSNQGQAAKNGNISVSLLNFWDEKQKVSQFDFHGPVTFSDEKLRTDDVDKLSKESKVYTRPIWSGFETKYFVEALVPLSGGIDKVNVAKSGNLVVNSFETAKQTLSPGESLQVQFLAYFGPLDLDILQNVDHHLDEAVDFGFFSPLAIPLRHVLNFFYGFVGNYGIAIILLTVIIKLLFWPLTQKSYTSMKEMQKLQPEMQRIREKHKGDRERMNMEVMKLYKDKRVNPLGGCLPMLVQIPVFFALYKVLMVDIGLRHAPFVFWITDLSEKDPFYITPLIMGGTMFVQQKMTPSTMDPMQAKIFMFMPVVFTVMFLNFPSGLVIYWLVNNLLTILQQYFIHKKK